jgi:hypothetical protein
MLGESEEFAKSVFGRPLPTAKPRHQADRALRFLTESLKIEIGLRAKKICYVIFRKRTGAPFQPLEVQSLLYSIAHAAEWEEHEAAHAQARAARSRSSRTKTARPTRGVADYIYREREGKTAAIKRVLLAQLHASQSQLVVFSPDWMPDLSALARTPLS